MSSLELLPKPAQVTKVVSESADVKSLVLQPEKTTKMKALPGQFVEVSIQGAGEATFAISRLPRQGKEFTISVKRVGHLTRMLHRCSAGDTVGVRGPYGNSFPVKAWKGKGIVIIGGGIGLAPLRPVVDSLLDTAGDYKSIDIVFGARSPQEMLFTDDLNNWEHDERISLYTTIDIPAEGWSGRVGLIPTVVKDLALKPDNRVAVICGPPIMIKFTILALKELGWSDNTMYTTLEMKMQCGIGQCGRCNIGDKMICKDGPVFRLDQIPSYALLE